MPEADALPQLRDTLARYCAGTASTADVAGSLVASSGLPGPRANLALAWAFAREAPDEMIMALTDHDDEYVRMCAVMGLGRLWVDAGSGAGCEQQLHRHASDRSWRVREGVAMALQLIGDEDPAALRDIVWRWSMDAEPSVSRAAIAGVCEPRLLRDEATGDVALDACAAATAVLLALSPERRRQADARALRQALGYCWSVAVAARLEPGLERFRSLDASDPDVVWIIRENERKARLRRVLASLDVGS